MKKIQLIHRGSFVLLQLFFASLVHAALPADVLESAEKGKASAQYSIARSYELGNRVKSDNAKAIEWYTKAADQGHVDAAYRLGLIYYKGVGGFKVNLNKAFRYISQAANKNHKNSQANLAKMYENGDGVKRNEELSDYWYEQAFTAQIQSFDEYIKEQSRSSDTVSAKPKKAVAVVRKKWKPNPPVPSKKTKLKFPKTITSFTWFEKAKPSAYLSSPKVECKVKGKKLVCSSSKLKGMHSTGLYRYKLKSIITAKRGSKDLQITYRKLYTSVPEESVGGYDDDDDEDENVKAKANQLVVGWEQKSHSLPCRFENAKTILCRPAGEDAFYIKAK